MAYNIAVVGATGMVGRNIIQTLEDREFPVAELYCLASENSKGKKIGFKGQELEVQNLEDFDFSLVDLVLSSPGSAISQKFTPKAAESGAVVIDNTSYFRFFDDIPLIVPEVNIEDIELYRKKNIISNPNCNVVPISVLLKPLNNLNKITKLVISTYQSTSGAGKKAMDELYDQTKAKFENDVKEPKVFPHPIAFNVIPQVGDFDEDGNADEEVKTRKELQKILKTDADITATCVRIPTFVAHSASIYIEFEDEIEAEDARKILRNAEGVLVIDNIKEGEYITPLYAVGDDAVYVSRIRKAFDNKKNALNIWVSSDNLRKGAALNAVQIAEELIEKHL